MSKPLVLDCLNCGKSIVGTIDESTDNEITCPQCGSVIVLPRNREKPPFVKPFVKKEPTR
jgi:DNA-directed RNA polymerase subunit RPC12/RpoP